MEYSERERLINQIASRNLYIQLNKLNFVLKHPRVELKYRADLVYKQALENSRFEEFLTVPTNVLVKRGVLIPNHEESIAALTKVITDLQVELFRNLINPIAQKDIRKRLKLTKEKLLQTIQKKHALDDVTLEGFANLSRLQFLIFKITFYRGKRFWSRLNQINYNIMEKLIYKYVASRVETSKIRELARTEPWHTIYTAGRPNPFGCKAVDLTDNQKELIYYTELYENASKAMEPPSEEVVKDDDIFDGWMHETIRKSKEDKKENTHKKAVGKKYENAQELFIPATSLEEAKQIDALNELSASMLKKKREAVIELRQEMNEAQLPDKQMEIQNQLRENILKAKGK